MENGKSRAKMEKKPKTKHHSHSVELCVYMNQMNQSDSKMQK